MTTFIFLCILVAVFAVVVKNAPHWLAVRRDEKRLAERPQRTYFVAELPSSFAEGRRAMAAAWTTLSTILSGDEVLEMRYDAVCRDGGSVEVQVVVGCSAAIERRVKAALRRAYANQATFLQLQDDPFDELHAKLNAALEAELDVEPAVAALAE